MERNTNIVVFWLLLAVINRPVFTGMENGEWKANVVKSLDSLVSSCVVIPCSFTHSGGNLPSSKLRGIWHIGHDKNKRVYHEDNTLVLENYRDRTRLIGHMGQNNCTLEINKVKDHDNGPFCFRVELALSETDPSTREKFSFVEKCAELTMLPDPPTPRMTHPKTAYQGVPFTVTCTVPHTCPTHVPVLTWSRGTTEETTVAHREVHPGNWEVQSILTLIPEETDDHTEVSCTSVFHGKKTSSQKMMLYVKRKVNYNHIIIPAAVTFGCILIFSVFCILMVKKYKARIAELQNQDGSMWNRLSRMSRRMRPQHAGLSHTEQRRSIWSRFSRRPKMNTRDEMPNNVHLNSSANQKFSKPRCPSPKSLPKSCNYKEEFDEGNDYANSADLNIYGNV